MALKTLRDGFRHACREVPVRSFDAQPTYYGAFRSLARLLVMEANVRAENGDWRSALGSDLDAMELGIKMPHGAPLLGLMVGLACEEIGARDAPARIDHLDAESALASLHRLRALLASRVSLADALRDEMWQTEAALDDAFGILPLRAWASARRSRPVSAT